MEQALALDTVPDFKIELAAVNEVRGNFNPVEVVTFDGVSPIPQPAGAEEENTVSSADEPPRSRSDDAPKVRAKVREDADEEGSRGIQNKQAPRRANFFQRIFGR